MFPDNKIRGKTDSIRFIKSLFNCEMLDLTTYGVSRTLILPLKRRTFSAPLCNRRLVCRCTRLHSWGERVIWAFRLMSYPKSRNILLTTAREVACLHILAVLQQIIQHQYLRFDGSAVMVWYGGHLAHRTSIFRISTAAVSP
jgi:hypothetical protein